MKNQNLILLPAFDKQLNFFLENIDPINSKILVIGYGAELISDKLSNGNNVTMIVDDNEQLMLTRIKSPKNNFTLKLMEFINTDFAAESFDFIFSQASITVRNRNKIIKEIHKILKPNGIFCVGEIVTISSSIPKIIQNIFETSNLYPIHLENFEKDYSEKGFKFLASINLSSELKYFYKIFEKETDKYFNSSLLDENRLMRKLNAKIKHEANVFLKMGGDKHIGFITALLERK